MTIHKAFFQNNTLLLSVLLLIGSTLISCSTKQKIVQEPSQASVLITYEKKRSRGNRLPLYTIEVLENKSIRYTGIANVDPIGERIIELQNAPYETIKKKVKATDFKNLQPTYMGNKRDLPLTAITYGGHTVTYQEEACPKTVIALANFLEEAIME